MTKLIYDRDIDPAALAGQTIAVIGYGSQGEAHARNLADGGHNVVVGLRPGSASAERAREAGLTVRDAGSASAAAQVVMLLVPDTAAPSVYELELEPRCVGQVAHLDHLDEALELGQDLVQMGLVPAQDDGHPGEAGLVCRAHRERLDVEGPRAEQAGDAVQRARPVHHERADDMARGRRSAHSRPAAHGWSPSTMSERPLPGSIIG
jgi:hypothetical protein